MLRDRREHRDLWMSRHRTILLRHVMRKQFLSCVNLESRTAEFKYWMTFARSQVSRLLYCSDPAGLTSVFPPFPHLAFMLLSLPDINSGAPLSPPRAEYFINIFSSRSLRIELRLFSRSRRTLSRIIFELNFWCIHLHDDAFPLNAREFSSKWHFKKSLRSDSSRWIYTSEIEKFFYSSPATQRQAETKTTNFRRKDSSKQKWICLRLSAAEEWRKSFSSNKKQKANTGMKLKSVCRSNIYVCLHSWREALCCFEWDLQKMLQAKVFKFCLFAGSTISCRSLCTREP